MARITQIITSAKATINYGMINDLLGQAVSFMVLSGNVTVISDNNPADTVARIITIQVGDCPHYIKFNVNAYGTFYVTIRNLTNTGDIGGSTSYSISTSYMQNFNAWMIYSSSVVLCRFATQNADLCVFKCTDTHWYLISSQILIFPNSNSLIFNYADDVSSLVLASPNYNGYDADGNYYPIQSKLILNNTILQSFQPISLYGLPPAGLISNNTYQDAAGSYWHYTNSLGITDYVPI